MHGFIRVMAVAMVAVSITAVAADAPPTDRFTVGQYLLLQTASAARFSPDGTQVVYTRSRINIQEDKVDTALWIVGADGQHHRFLAKGSGAAWSPDGKSIAYLAQGEPKGVQIFVIHLDVVGPPTQVTHADEAPANLRWSPDSRHIGYTMKMPDLEKWNVDLPPMPEGAKWAKAPRYTERLHYRQDRVGFTERGWRRLYLVAADGGEARQLTTGNWSVGESEFEVADDVSWDFVPDGRSIIIEGYKEDDRDVNDRDSYLYSIDIATGAAKRLTPTRGAWLHPAVSPDGRTIAYLGHEHNEDSHRDYGLYTMSLDGSNATLRSAGFTREPQNPVWAPDSSALYFTAEDRGSVHLYSWSASAGIRQLTHADEVIRDPSVGRGGIVAARTTFQSPADVYLWNPRRSDSPQQLTHLNTEQLHGISLATEEEIEFGSSGGARIQGWLVKPPGFDPAKHYPMLLEIHGGPHAMFSVAFSAAFQNFAANDYLVLYLNPRGSTGYGSAFANAIAKHYPGVDFDDLMAGVDTVVGNGYVDTARMYVAGCSGGGVLSSWVTSHTDRFAAAAVRCPVIDWISMVGETDVPNFTYRWFNKPFWEDPTDWLAESSLMHVGQVKTPTLLMTGELDMRTPIAQTEEYYAALKYRGVPAALLRFDGEYHGTASKPSNWMRTQLYMMGWFQRYGAKPGSPVAR